MGDGIESFAVWRRRIALPHTCGSPLACTHSAEIAKTCHFGCRNQNESESIQTSIEGLEVEIASK
jgi:hypothetical protein